MNPKEPHTLAWHFLPAVGKLSHNDPRPVIVGKALHHKGPVVCCESGLHASISLRDELSHRCGTALCRVECWGDVDDTKSDKIAVRHRRCLAMADITPQLRLFAVLCAESVLPIFEKRHPKDKRPRECIETTKRYLDGKATLDELRRARADAAYAYAADAAAAAAAAYAAADAAAAAAAAAAGAAAGAAAAAADAYAAADAAAAAAAQKANQQQTADICREILTKAVMEAAERGDG